MNKARFEDNTLRPTYMSQVEANEVLELWAERQREDSARQSLVTVHDVAEATQLSVQDVEKLLQEIRTKQPEPKVASARQVERHMPEPRTSEPTLLEAYQRLAPLSGFVSFLYACFAFNHVPYYEPFFQSLLHTSRWIYFVYAMGVAFVYLPKYLRQRRSNKQSSRLQEASR